MTETTIPEQDVRVVYEPALRGYDRTLFSSYEEYKKESDAFTLQKYPAGEWTPCDSVVCGACFKPFVARNGVDLWRMLECGCPEGHALGHTLRGMCEKCVEHAEEERRTRVVTRWKDCWCRTYRLVETEDEEMWNDL